MSHSEVTRPETETETDTPLSSVSGQYRGKNEAPAASGAGRFMRDLWHALADLVMADRVAAGLVPANAEDRYRAALVSDLRREYTYRAAALKDAQPGITASELAHAIRGHATPETLGEQIELAKIAKASQAAAARNMAHVGALRAEPRWDGSHVAGLAAARAALPEPQEAS